MSWNTTRVDTVKTNVTSANVRHAKAENDHHSVRLTVATTAAVVVATTAAVVSPSSFTLQAASARQGSCAESALETASLLGSPAPLPHLLCLGVVDGLFAASNDDASHDSVVARVGDEQVAIGDERDAQWIVERIVVSSYARTSNGFAFRSWRCGWALGDCRRPTPHSPPGRRW